MKEYIPRKKIKIFTKEFMIKYSYVFILAIVLFIGTSYSLTFFIQNKNIATGSLTTAPLNITLSDNSIIATGLSVPNTNQDGMDEYVKSFTITNNTTTDGIVKLTLERTSGLNLTDLSYALIVNGAVQEIGDMTSDGIFLDTAIMGNEVINVELRLWPKTSYTGTTTTFQGEITSEIKYLGEKASNRSDLANSYVKFNCSGNTCETWRIVKVENERLVLTREADLEGASTRTDSGKYNPSLTFNDNSMITSVSTDNKNVYLAKTVKIIDGDGTSTNPFVLSNSTSREADKKVIAAITYKNGTETIGTQYIYYNETNYISQVVNDPDFQGWTDGTNTYQLGDVVNFTSDTNLTAKVVLSLLNAISRMSQSKSYIASYDDIIEANPTFTTQDQVSTSSTKQTVYYFTGDDAAANANVLFAGYCWQIIRTTDNGGIRMIYNGVAVNNKCETTRTATKGINGANGTSTSLSSATLFGRSYDYNLDTGEFTLQDSTGLPTSWNNTNYKDLIGTYTCNSNSATCTTLYYVGSYKSNTSAYAASYTIGDVAHFSQLGKSAFNPNYYSPAMVGYMFNTEYDYKSSSKSGEYFTNATWNGTTYDLTSGNEGTAPDVSHHYICDTDCTKVRYYYYSTNYYILLENGTTVEDAIYKMTGNGTPETKAKAINANYELNNYNSAMKGYLDNWYKKNLTTYASYLDNGAVYCNDRSIRELGGWSPTNSPSLTRSLQFYQYSANRDLNCVNEWDRFAVTNNKAELTYPIGLLTEPERNLMTANFAKTGQYYWGASPYFFNRVSANVRDVNTTGDNNYNNVGNSGGARGVVSLRPGTKLEKGTGTYNDPYIVGPIVARTS